MRECNPPWPQAKGTNNRLMRHAAERDDRAKTGHGRDRCRQKWTAVGDFGWRRFVLRRHATHRIGDRAGDELQAIIAAGAIGAGGKTIFDQRLIKKLAGEIAGKWPPRAIRAAQAGRETDDKEMRIKGPKHRNRRIVPVWLRFP